MEWIKFNKDVELERWHFWFAWHPVKVKTFPDGSEKIVWLTWVLRCYIIFLDWNLDYTYIPVYKEIKEN